MVRLSRHGQASGIVDGQVVELPGGVKSALKDEGVKVRAGPERVSEGLIGDDRRADVHPGVAENRIKGKGAVGKEDEKRMT
jgi:hypothetical protein